MFLSVCILDHTKQLSESDIGIHNFMNFCIQGFETADFGWSELL